MADRGAKRSTGLFEETAPEDTRKADLKARLYGGCDMRQAYVRRTFRSALPLRHFVELALSAATPITISTA